MRVHSTATTFSERVIPPLARPGYCDHGSARHIRVYLPYADANAIRLRTVQAAGASEPHVSWLYAIPGGWGWTICRDCQSQARKSA
jgi:hypothetical protein